MENNKRKGDYEERKEYFCDYFNKNKEKLTQQILCEDCGGKYQKYNKTTHIRSKKHINTLLIKKLQDENNEIKKIVAEVNQKLNSV